jgi:hypothetical protein
VGFGGFATVYHGKLADGRETAAKLVTSNNSEAIEYFFQRR